MQRNRLEVMGFLAAKPVVRYLPSGTAVANARLGESYRFQDHEGKPQQQTNWHNLSFYGELAKVATGYDKGDNVFVEGTIEQRQFTPKDGGQRIVHEVVVRHCHQIVRPGRAQSTAVEEPVSAEEQNDDWPVG